MKTIKSTNTVKGGDGMGKGHQNNKMKTIQATNSIKGGAKRNGGYITKGQK